MKELKTFDTTEDRLVRSSSLIVRLGDATWEVPRHEPDQSTWTKAADVAGERQPKQPGLGVDVRNFPDKPITLEIVRQHVERAVQDSPQRRPPAYSPSKEPFVRRDKHVMTRLFTSMLQIILPNQSNRSGATLKGGILVGMMFGCLSMWLFHELLFITPASQSIAKKPNAAVAVLSSSMTPVALSLPGFKISLVQAGPFSTPSALDQAIHALQKKGFQAIVSAPSSRTADIAVAVQGQGADRWLKEVQAVTPTAKVHSVQVDARTIPLMGSANQATVASIQSWLSSAASAYLALSAWLSDEGRVSDAKTALVNARAAYPGTNKLAQTGIQTQLVQVEQNLNEAQAAMNKSDKIQLMSRVLQGFRTLMTLQGMAPAK